MALRVLGHHLYGQTVSIQGQRRHVKSGGAKNGNIASAWELCWGLIMKSIGKLMGVTYIGTTIKALELKATSIL